MHAERITPDNPGPRERPAQPTRFGGALAFPEGHFLATVLLVLGSLGILLLVANWILADHHARITRQNAATLAQLVARHCAARPEEEPLPERFQRGCGPFAQTAGIVAVRLTTPDGQEHLWRPPDRAMRPAHSARGDFAHPLGVFAVELSAIGYRTAFTGLVVAVAVLATLACGAFVLVYRTARRRLEPLASVERSLENYGSGIEPDLRMLQVSDTLGSVSEVWNRMVRELAELQAAAGAAPDDSAAELQLELRELRGALDAAPCGVLRIGPEQRVTLANAMIARMLRRPPAELLDRPLADVLGAELAEQALSGRRVDHDFGSGDNTRTLRLECRPAAAEGEPRLLFAQDISHLREAERTRDNFLYHVTHELRTPLTNIAAYAETLSQPEFSDEATRKECYNVIVSETQRLSHLVEDILNVSQLEVGTMRMDWKRVDLERLARKVVQDSMAAADEKRIELSLELAPKLPEIRGDKDRLAVLLTNLIGNAVKYTPEGGKVRVSVDCPDGGNVRMAVCDTGIGIPANEQGHIFDKFYRVACDAVQSVKGTGIGLALCREIVNLHSGDLQLTSEPGRGSTFTVELPIGDLSALGAGA